MLDTIENRSKRVGQSKTHLQMLMSSEELKKRAGFRSINADLLEDLMSRDDFAPLSCTAPALKKAA